MIVDNRLAKILGKLSVLQDNGSSDEELGDYLTGEIGELVS